MSMKATLLAIVLVAGACSQDVDLVLEVPDVAPPTGSATPGSVGHLAWSYTERGRESSELQRVEWAADGTLLAAGGYARAADGLGGDAYLDRVTGDGEVLWESDITRVELIALAADCCGLDAGRVDMSTTTIASIDEMIDGRILVAANLEAGNSDDFDFLPSYGFLRWYGPDGAVLETRAFPTAPSAEPVVAVHAARGLADGGIVFTASRGSRRPFTGMVTRLDADGGLVWSTAVDNPNPLTDLIENPDGSLLFKGVYGGDGVAIEGHRAGGASGEFVARLEQDGSCSWIRAFDGANPIYDRGGLASAPGGGAIVIGAYYPGDVPTGDFALEGSTDTLRHFIAALDETGQVLSVDPIEGPPPVVGDVNDWNASSAVVAGETIAIAGHTGELDATRTQIFQTPFVGVYDHHGHLLAERRMLATPLDEDNRGVAHATAIRPDGRAAVAGYYDGRMDFGAGPSESDHRYGGGAFLAVYDPDDQPGPVD